MSSPNMKTGRNIGNIPENFYNETFYIIYLILNAILRRIGYRDCVEYSNHNNTIYNQHMFDSGIVFNLKSKYGVGSSLISLIIELFSTTYLDYYKNKDDVFFQEISRLTSEVSYIIRSHNPDLENKWIIDYSMRMVNIQDNISNEREKRLSDLLPNEYEEEDYSSSEEIYDDIIYFDENSDDIQSKIKLVKNIYNKLNQCKNKKCLCPFCDEFREYYDKKSHDVTRIIDNMLTEISVSS